MESGKRALSEAFLELDNEPNNDIICYFFGLEVIKHFSVSTELSMKLNLLINVKMPTIIGILPCMSRIEMYIQHLKSLR